MKKIIILLVLSFPLAACMHPMSPAEIKQKASSRLQLESTDSPEKVEGRISELMMKCLGNVPVPLEFRPIHNGGRAIIARGGAGPYLEYLVEINPSSSKGSNVQGYINSYTVYDNDYKQIIINAAKGTRECPQ